MSRPAPGNGSPPRSPGLLLAFCALLSAGAGALLLVTGVAGLPAAGPLLALALFLAVLRQTLALRQARARLKELDVGGSGAQALDVSERRALEASLRQAQVSVDNAQDLVIWVRLADQRMAYANKAACDALGYTREELLGLKLLDINATRAGDKWEADCDSLRASSRSVIEAEYRRKDGSLFPVEISAFHLRHEGEEYAVGIVRDIARRKQDEARLGLEIRRNGSLAEAARSLLGAAPDIKAIAGQLLDRACELTGSRHGYVAFIDQDTGGLMPQAMSAMMKTGECTLGALPVTFPAGPDGRYRGLWGHSLNTREGHIENDPRGSALAMGLPEGHVGIDRLLTVPALAKGRLVGQIALANPGREYTRDDLEVVASLADVFALGVEQVLAQRALVAAKEEAEISNRAKSDFLANMTHEVRTPLNGILGMLQVLQGTGLTGDQQQYAAVALDSAERLNRLIENILDYARLDSDKTEAECRSFPPTDVLHALEAVFAPRARDKGLAFTARAGEDLPELILSDPQVLLRALTQLLDNAVRFTSEGGVTLGAALAPEDSSLLVFSVEDSGIGVPPDKRQQVFEAFVQADSSPTRAACGAGLGLAIARKLAARLEGRLEMRDRPGGGTVMLLTMPVDCTAAKKG